MFWLDVAIFARFESAQDIFLSRPEKEEAATTSIAGMAACSSDVSANRSDGQAGGRSDRRSRPAPRPRKEGREGGREGGRTRRHYCCSRIFTAQPEIPALLQCSLGHRAAGSRQGDTWPRQRIKSA